MILFEISNNSIPKKDYELLISLDQLYKVNKFFINFDNINEIVNSLINSLKQKTSNIKFNDNICCIQILNPITNKSFDLSLKLKEKDINSRISYLEEIITQQNKKIAILEEKMKEFEPMFEEYKNKKLKKINFFDNSEILNENEKELLLEWLPKKPKNIKLLLNSNKDGDSTNTFINKVNGKSPTYAIIETTKGYKFGGYTTKLWKQGKIEDNDAFVFSVNNKKKYNILKPEYALGFSEGNHWLFGYTYNAIVIRDNCTASNKDNFVENGAYNIKEKYELNGGERSFIVKSFEIHYIEY